MSESLAELSARAHALPEQERARLAEELLASLDPHQGADLAPDLEDTLRRRIAQVHAGAVTLVPANEAMAQVRRALTR